eukprot:6366621-Alexandrium_andersonii.AAC.1
MSASLVGSEMCIRDRDSTPGHPGPPWATPRHARQVRTAQARTRSAAMPVSYTHLTLPTICSV